MAQAPKDGPKPPSSTGELVRAYDAAWRLAGSVGLGVAVGYALDEHFGTRPWAMVAGAGLGSVAGFIAFFRAVMKQGKRR